MLFVVADLEPSFVKNWLSLKFLFLIICELSLIFSATVDIFLSDSIGIYKVIRPVLNFFFFTIRFYKHQKTLESTKRQQKAPKSIKKH